jgi:hypothetical protein
MIKNPQDAWKDIDAPAASILTGGKAFFFNILLTLPFFRFPRFRAWVCQTPKIGHSAGFWQ